MSITAIRFSRSLWGPMILEVKAHWTETICLNGSGYYDYVPRSRWRRATREEADEIAQGWRPATQE